MIRLPLIVIGIWLGYVASTWAQDAPPAWDHATVTPEDAVVAFVGRKMFVEERNLDQFIDVVDAKGRSTRRKVPNFDTRYEARYEILDSVVGLDGETMVDFEAYDHYSRPYFPKVDTPLLFLISHKGGWVHSKYLFYDVKRTTDGDWAICGSADGRSKDGDDGAVHVQPIGFLDPVKNEAGDACKSGTRVRDIFTYQNDTRFKPNKWRQQCSAEHPRISGSMSADKSLALMTARQNQIRACVERLELQDK